MSSIGENGGIGGVGGIGPSDDSSSGDSGSFIKIDFDKFSIIDDSMKNGVAKLMFADAAQTTAEEVLKNINKNISFDDYLFAHDDSGKRKDYEKPKLSFFLNFPAVIKGLDANQRTEVETYLMTRLSNSKTVIFDIGLLSPDSEIALQSLILLAEIKRQTNDAFKEDSDLTYMNSVFEKAFGAVIKNQAGDDVGGEESSAFKQRLVEALTKIGAKIPAETSSILGDVIKRWDNMHQAVVTPVTSSGKSVKLTSAQFAKIFEQLDLGDSDAIPSSKEKENQEFVFNVRSKADPVTNPQREEVWGSPTETILNAQKEKNSMVLSVDSGSDHYSKSGGLNNYANYQLELLEQSFINGSYTKFRLDTEMIKRIAAPFFQFYLNDNSNLPEAQATKAFEDELERYFQADQPKKNFAGFLGYDLAEIDPEVKGSLLFVTQLKQSLDSLAEEHDFELSVTPIVSVTGNPNSFSMISSTNLPANYDKEEILYVTHSRGRQDINYKQFHESFVLPHVHQELADDPSNARGFGEKRTVATVIDGEVLTHFQDYHVASSDDIVQFTRDDVDIYIPDIQITSTIAKDSDAEETHYQDDSSSRKPSESLV